MTLRDSLSSESEQEHLRNLQVHRTKQMPMTVKSSKKLPQARHKKTASNQMGSESARIHPRQTSYVVEQKRLVQDNLRSSCVSRSSISSLKIEQNQKLDEIIRRSQMLREKRMTKNREASQSSVGRMSIASN